MLKSIDEEEYTIDTKSIMRKYGIKADKRLVSIFGRFRAPFWYDKGIKLSQMMRFWKWARFGGAHLTACPKSKKVVAVEKDRI